MRDILMKTVVAMVAVTIALSANAESRGKRNTSSSGAYSFRVESRGRILPVYNHNGRSYVEGTFGNTYAIRVFNHTGNRVEAVVTVDGRDVVSGKVGNFRNGRGYVIDPYDSVLIEGFRQSWSNVAAFTFTSVNNAYATRMGDGSNVGVIGVALFKEQRYRPRPAPTYIPRAEPSQGLGTGYGRSSEAKRSSSPKGYRQKAAPEMEDSQGLGTEYGETTYAPSTQTTFRRASTRPHAILAMRYDDRAGLIALGVLPRPRPQYHRYPKPNPFPGSPEPVSFAPPPPPRQWWE